MSISGRIANDVISGCLSKSILQTRPKIKELNLEIILMYVELEKNQLVCDELLAGFDNKSPKIQVGCILYAREALRQFGPRIIKVGPIIKLLPVLLEHKDKNVREETRQLTIEIYRWIKDAMKPQISNLKPVILNELEEEFNKIKDEKASPTRFIKSEQEQINQPKSAENSDEQTEDNNQNAPVEEIDPFEFIEPVEILSKLPSNFYELVEAKKWQERRDVIDNVTNLLETIPKIAPGDFNELCKALKKVIGKDANIVVVISAAKCLGELAKKLRKNFSPYSHSCIMVIIEKFKEKKQNVIQALREAVDSCLLSANFETILEDVTNYLNNKNPQIKQEVAQMINRYIQESKLDFLSNKKNIKLLSGALTKALNDMDSNVRDSSAECLGTLMKAVTEKVLTPFITEVEPIKLVKVKEFYETATIKYSVPTVSSSNASKSNQADKKQDAKPSAKSTRPKTTSSAALGKKSAISNSNKNLNDQQTGSSNLTSTRSASALTTKSKSSLTSATASKSRLTKQISTTKIETISSDTSNLKNLPLMSANNLKEQRFQDEKQLKLFKWNFTTPREEFFVELKELMQQAGWNSTLISNCFHSDFKFHLKAIESINEFLLVEDNEEAVLHNSDLIFKWIALRFFDTNPSVILKMFDLLLKIFDIMKDKKILLNEIEAQNFIPYLILKTGDPKDILRQKVHDVLNRIKDIYSPIKLYTYVSTGLTSKNSRQRTTCLEELSYFIKTYGTAVCQPSFTVACKEISKQIGDKDGSVRNAALNCIVEFYYFEGEKVLKILSNLNHKELEMLEKRLKRATRPTGVILVKPLEATILINEQLKTKVFANNHQQPNDVEPTQNEHQFQAPLQRAASQIKANGVPQSQHKTLIKPRSALVRPTAKLNNNEHHISPPQQQNYQSNMQHSPPRNRSPSPDHLTYTATNSTLNAIRGSAIKSRIASSLANAQQAQQIIKPIQLDFQDTDQEYNRLGTAESKESKYSTYRTSSTAFKSALKSSNKEIDDILNESSIHLPKRRSTFGIANSSHYSKSENSHNLKLLYANLISSEMDVVVETLNQLNEMLNNQKQATEIFSDTINDLIMRCSMQLRLVKTKYSRNEQDDNKVNNLFVHVTLTLYLIFKNNALAKKVDSEALVDLLPRAFDFLIYKKLCAKLDDTINNIIFLILINTDLTQTFLAIIRLLHSFIAEDKDGKQSDHTDLTIKCFWKLTRLVEKVDQRINVSLILLELKNFLEAFPSSYWKSDPSKNEIAYRTIKTLIYTLVKSKKQRIFLYMNKIPNKENTVLYKLMKKAIDQVEEEDKDQDNLKDQRVDDLKIDELNYINDILIKLNEELKTEYFMQVIHFCDEHPQFNLKEFMTEFHNEFFANYIQEKLAELKLDSNLKERLKLGNGNATANKQNGHYSTNCKSTTEQELDDDHAVDRLKLQSNRLSFGNSNHNLDLQKQRANFGFDRSNLIDKKSSIELKRLSTKPEELNVENVQEWYLTNMKLLGVDGNNKADLAKNQTKSNSIDDTVKESIKRTENIMSKTKDFLSRYEE